ncbi:nicotinate-nucleotide adenylyltransferase [Levilactobacillus bambusae]|uniref:nicotinate-nucleotide adenylyltransferase n=1 Tax=Levilactobacillus bambusae TaxID=2024736 RepID=UPI001CDA9A11|nr:nicotinate-nucleotide adenylyltransferase [Levilactobacillus bambusae]
MQVQVDEIKPKHRIGILGGTFNPPHMGHLIMADQVCTQLDLEQVLFMPDALPPHIDQKLTIQPEDRVNMVKSAIADNPKFGLELEEVNRGGKSYTFETMKILTERHPENQYYFIIGGDMVDYLPKWYRIEDLVHLVQFVGVGREGFRCESPYPVMWVDAPEVNVSSTQIRQLVSQRRSIRYLVPMMVERYIKEHQLYHD